MDIVKEQKKTSTKALKTEGYTVWLDIEEAIAYMPGTLAKQTVYRLIEAGKIKFYRPGRKYYFTREDIDEYLKGGATIGDYE